MLLTNKVALITATADETSLQWDLAKLLADAGAAIVVHDNEGRDELKKRVDYLHNVNRRALAIMADLSEQSQREKLLDQVIDKLGRLDILVMAMPEIEDADLLTLSSAAVADMTTKLEATILLAKTMVRQMLAQGEGGRILIVGQDARSEDVLSQTVEAFAYRLSLELSPFAVSVHCLASIEEAKATFSQTVSVKDLDKSFKHFESPAGESGDFTPHFKPKDVQLT